MPHVEIKCFIGRTEAIEYVISCLQEIPMGMEQIIP